MPLGQFSKDLGFDSVEHLPSALITGSVGSPEEGFRGGGRTADRSKPPLRGRAGLPLAVPSPDFLTSEALPKAAALGCSGFLL